MIIETVFRRGPRCSHSGKRECTDCFKQGIAEALGSEKALRIVWENRTVKGPDERVESITIMDDVSPDGEAKSLAELP